MITISELMTRMLSYSKGNIPDIDHFIRVWTYARTIGKIEELDHRGQFIVEAAAINHDIACPLCREKYGNTNGKHQEEEGGPLVREFLADSGIPQEWLERIVYLVEHHHTYTVIDGIEHQILIEADYIANATEKGYSAENVRNFSDKVMKTKSGREILESVTGL